MDTYPEIYNFKSPEKHMFDGGVFDEEGLKKESRWKRVEMEYVKTPHGETHIGYNLQSPNRDFCFWLDHSPVVPKSIYLTIMLDDGTEEVLEDSGNGMMKNISGQRLTTKVFLVYATGKLKILMKKVALNEQLRIKVTYETSEVVKKGPV